MAAEEVLTVSGLSKTESEPLSVPLSPGRALANRATERAEPGLAELRSAAATPTDKDLDLTQERLRQRRGSA